MEKKESQVTKEDVELQKALMAMYNSGDPDLKEQAIIRLFEMIEDFIWYIMKKWYPTFYADKEAREELFGCCKVAFLTEIGKFDPEQGTLSTFLTYPFKHEMYEWINRETHRTSGYLSKMIGQVEAAIRELQSIGAEVTSSSISHLSGLSVKKVEQALERIEFKNPASLNTEEQLEEILTGNAKSPEQLFLEAEQSETIAKALKNLSSQDRTAIILYYGLDGTGPKSYNAVAKLMHISPPQAQTAIARGLHLLRNDTALKVLFGKGAANHRQKQLDSIEISLITNDSIISAYSVLDELDETESNTPSDTISSECVVITF